MKTFCTLHGCHFEKEQIKADCSFWKDWGMEKLSYQDKRKVYAWVNLLPIDMFAIKYNLATYIQLGCRPIEGGFKNEWEELVPGYKDWPDEKRRDYQRQHFLKEQAKQKAEWEKKERIRKMPIHKYLWHRFKGDI